MGLFGATLGAPWGSSGIPWGSLGVSGGSLRDPGESLGAPWGSSGCPGGLPGARRPEGSIWGEGVNKTYEKVSIELYDGQKLKELSQLLKKID